jgi:asparagine synthase (glutamine-hydrolysing)
LSFPSQFRGDATAHTRDALRHTVRQHFVSDVPVGLFLSGGIDSTALLALAQLTGHQGISTFAIAVDDPAADESALARRSAQHFGADHHELRLDANAVRPWFATFLQHLDQPSIDGFNTFTVSALARQHGMKVVLSGLGGDELFGGYSSFQKIPALLRLHPLLSRLPGLCPLLERGKPQHRRLADFLRSPGRAEDAYSALRGIFSQAEAEALTQWITGTRAAPPEPQPLPPSPSAGDAICQLELTRYLRNQLLRDSDVMSMAHGLELRVPFVDQDLWEQTAMIPAKQRLRGQKSLLTAAVPEIPDWILNQKKRGFLFPYQKWLGSDWGQSLTAAAAGAPTPMPNWYQQWSVFVLKHCIEKLGLSA